MTTNDQQTTTNDHKPPTNEHKPQQRTANGHPCTPNPKSKISFLFLAHGNYMKHLDFKKDTLQCQISVVGGSEQLGGVRQSCQVLISGEILIKGGFRQKYININKNCFSMFETLGKCIMNILVQQNKF